MLNIRRPLAFMREGEDKIKSGRQRVRLYENRTNREKDKKTRKRRNGQRIQMIRKKKKSN